MTAQLAAAVVVFEAGALFDGVGEFVVAVGEFVGAEVELEAFGDRWIVVTDSGQGALRGWPVADHGDAIGREIGLDAMGDQQIEPVVALEAFAVDFDVVAVVRARHRSMQLNGSMPRVSTNSSR